MTHEEQVAEFFDRSFSGRDVAHLMDMEGIGVGATMNAVRCAELDHEAHPDIYRALDGDRKAIQKVVDWLKVKENDFHAAPRDWLSIAKEIEKEFLS
jgi:hypothetical protein